MVWRIGSAGFGRATDHTEPCLCSPVAAPFAGWSRAREVWPGGRCSDPLELGGAVLPELRVAARQRPVRGFHPQTRPTAHPGCRSGTVIVAVELRFRELQAHRPVARRRAQIPGARSSSGSSAVRTSAVSTGIPMSAASPPPDGATRPVVADKMSSAASNPINCRTQLTVGEDTVDPATWADSVPQRSGVAPRIRIGAPSIKSSGTRVLSFLLQRLQLGTLRNGQLLQRFAVPLPMRCDPISQSLLHQPQLTRNV
jgi:hypothetical protein